MIVNYFSLTSIRDLFERLNNTGIDVNISTLALCPVAWEINV